jgi:signal transduction histidine kinase
VSRSAPADPVRLSPRAQSLTGLSGRVSTVAALLRRVDRDDRRSLVAAIRRALSERSAKDRSPEQGDPGRPSRPALESTVRIGGSGSRRWIRVRAAPRGDAPSSALDRGGWEAVLEDVTARQRTEQQRTEQIETLRADLAASARRVRHLAERLTDAEETERQRIASVLHDDLQPLVYGARVQIDTLRTQMEEGVVALDEFPDDAPPPREQLNGLSTQLKQAVSLTRSLSSTIRPPVLHSSSFADALQWLTVRVEETLGADVDLDLPRGMDIEGQGRRAFLFEAIRESVFNAVRHGEADRVVIRARQSSERTRVVIEDEGQGFDPEVLDDDASGDLRFGIRAIRQRLDDLGGRFRIDSAPDVGTRVMLTLPRRSAAPDESSG